MVKVREGLENHCATLVLSRWRRRAFPRCCVELRIACSDLTNRGHLLEVRPVLCVVKIFRRATSTWDKVSRLSSFTTSRSPRCQLIQTSPLPSTTDRSEWTETVKDSLSPKFTTQSCWTTCSKKVQKLQFSVYDVDSGSKDVEHGGGQLIGSVETSLGTVRAAPVMSKFASS